MSKNRALGKGLAALIGNSNKGTFSIINSDVKKQSISIEVDIDKLLPNEEQPRKTFADEHLKELAISIKNSGIISPIVVRELNDNYQIIAGERRFRAAKMIGLKSVPVIIKNLDDKEVLEIALVENIQRHDLSPIEEAEAYQKLIREFCYTQEKLAEIMGKSRSHIANLIRLLSLSEEVKKYLNQGLLSMGHARALLGSKEATELAGKIIKENLNVRQTERLVKLQSQDQLTRKDDCTDNHELNILSKNLSVKLGLKVSIDQLNNKGKVTINFLNLNQLDNIIKLLDRNQI